MTLRYSTPGVYVESFDADPQRIRLRRTDVAGFVGIAARGPLHAAVKIQTWRQFESTFGGPMADAYLAYAVYGFFLNGGRTCWVVRAGDVTHARPAAVTLDVRGVGSFTLLASSPGAWGNDVVVTALWERDRIVALRLRDDAGRRQVIRLRSAGTGEQPTERVQTNLLGVADSELQELDDQSLVVTVPKRSGVRLVPLDAAHREARLLGGTDGAGTVRLEHLIGSDVPGPDPMGLAVLERVDGVSFIAIPDLMIGQYPATGDVGVSSFDVRAGHQAMMASCLRCKDRVALLDLPRTTTPSAAVDYPPSMQRTSMAALYYPWLVVEDALRLRGLVRIIPPSGHVAGMYARVDRKRGVHKPPANEALEGALDTSQALDDRTHGALNDAGVNAIRAVAGRGILVLGARTMDPDITWRYVNVRRLFLMIEETLDAQLQALVFEPNNAALWRDIRRAVAGFLDRLWRLGMLDGATADDAYTVRCDASTNPPWETEQGRVTCIVGLQPPYPAEFVIVRIGVARDGVEVRSDEVRDV